MIEQSHSNILSGKTRAKCPESVPKVSTHNSQQLQTEQTAIVVFAGPQKGAHNVVWLGFTLSASGTAHADRGYLYSLLPALQAGFSEDMGYDELYTAQGTDLPGVTVMKKVYEHTHTQRKAGIRWAVPLPWASLLWLSQNSLLRFLTHPGGLKLIIGRKTRVDSVLRA